MKEENLSGVLKSKMSPDELTLVPRSFDVIGSKEKAVAIIKIPEELKSREALIAEALMQVHKNVKSVLGRSSVRKGTYRLREYDLVLGEDDTEVVHREHGCSFKLDPRRVYFSPREGTERLRIARQVGAGEAVLVMFSGVGPFPILIAKKQPKVERVWAVELNPIAHGYSVKNVRLNRLGEKVLPILGDVREVCPRLGERFDRVLMPMPRGAQKFLDITIPCLRDGGILHFYHWAPEWNLFSEAEELVSTAAEKLGRKVDILNKIRVLPYGPRKWKVRIDVKVTWALKQ